jgi:hypothetical protein
MLLLTFALCFSYGTAPNSKTIKNSLLVSQKDDVHVCIMCLRAIMNYQVLTGDIHYQSHPLSPIYIITTNQYSLSLHNKWKGHMQPNFLFKSLLSAESAVDVCDVSCMSRHRGECSSV